MKKTIPFAILEEHHEAFFVWEWAKKTGFLTSEPHLLLHIDTHADMKPPVLRTAIGTIPGDTKKLKRFVHDELGIDTFIVPALYRGFFDEVVWLLQPGPQFVKPAPQKLYVRTFEEKGQVFVIGPETPGLDTGNLLQKRIPFRFETRTLQEPFKTKKKIILDIDLDYFSCETHPSLGKRLEITRAEFLRIKRNPYHFLRLHQECHPFQEKGRYYVQLGPHERETLPPGAWKVSEEKIRERIGVLCRWLSTHKINPVLIHLCRSRHSGFTPEDQWRFIEKELIVALKRGYSLRTISDL